MKAFPKTLSPQEQRIEEGQEETLYISGQRATGERVRRMLRGLRKDPPRLAIERACLMVESFKVTEHLPPVLRWARALENVLKKIEIVIGEDEIIVGRCGPPGRYGILYPELRGAWLEAGLETLPSRREGAFLFSESDAKSIREELLPYWKGRTLFEAVLDLLPEETRRLLYEENDPYTPGNILIEETTDRTSQQWVPDYEKVLSRGFNDIRRQAEIKLSSLTVYDRENNFRNAPFLKAVIIVCHAVVNFAKRHAEVARMNAQKVDNEKRRKELLEIAEICDWVPGNPARTFRDAIQSQWFTQVCFRFEQFHGGTVGNGRIDQYLYPYYRADIQGGRITDDDVLELLEHLWLNMAQNVTLRQSGAVAHCEGLPHFEATTIGGQTREGLDATNALSYLVLQSKKEFPLDYPDLAARIHSGTPEPFLYKVCELIKEGTGFPKLLNDEEVIPTLLTKGASIEEARDYCVSGCTEVRLINRDTYMVPTIIVNLGAALEMALNGGKLRSKGDKPIGPVTKDPVYFEAFEEMMSAFKLQVENLVNNAFIVDQIATIVRGYMLASPLQSCLHDLCMKNCVDIQQGDIVDGIPSGFWDAIGLGTVIDSLTAIKKLVFDDKTITMAELLQGLESNFEKDQMLRLRCLNAPKYGNNDAYADSVGFELEKFFRSLSKRYTNLCGGKLDSRYVPVTSHVPLGKIIGALPNGRKGGEPLSDGLSPSQGCDKRGPTATLLSVARVRKSKYKEGGEGVLNMKFSPQAVAGDSGTKTILSLIRAWCDLKIWHIQFNIVNSETLRAAQHDPETYRNLLVRVAGYSAYFVDLSKDLQNEIIERTEHRGMQ